MTERHCETCVYYDLPLYHPHCISCGGPAKNFQSWMERKQPVDYEETRSPASLIIGLEQLALIMQADGRIGDAQLLKASAEFIRSKMPRKLPLKLRASAVVEKADGTID